VIDGGKGQLGMAVQALKDIGREDIQCVGMAKARTEGAFSDQDVTATEERFFLPGRSNPALFPQSSEALKVLVSLRDEAHRFAITYHRKLRDQKMFQSQLDEVPGLGEKRKVALLKHFNSVEAIASANIDEIAGVSGMNKKVAQAVKDLLEREGVAEVDASKTDV
jgi:excinuclease ABC subunit C